LRCASETAKHRPLAGQEGTLANAPLRLGAVEWGLIALQSMLWGSSYFFIAVVQDQVPILTVVAMRGVAASIMLIAIVTSLGYRMPATLAEWAHFAFFSTFNTLIPFALIVWGQARATGGMAAILNASAPLFGIFLAHLLTHDEKLSVNKLAGILLGFVGVAILIGSDLAVMSSADLMARLALLAAPLLYVLANIYARNRLGEYPPFVIAMMQMAASVFISVPLALAVDWPWTLPMPSMTVLGAIIATGVFGSGLAALCHFTVLQRAGATNAMLVTLIMPLTPILLGGIFLGERLTGREIVGAVIIAAALLIIDGRLLRLLPRGS
jgi:drug/metabolite transporter (DMT)-like permease